MRRWIEVIRQQWLITVHVLAVIGVSEMLGPSPTSPDYQITFSDVVLFVTALVCTGAAFAHLYWWVVANYRYIRYGGEAIGDLSDVSKHRCP